MSNNGAWPPPAFNPFVWPGQTNGQIQKVTIPATSPWKSHNPATPPVTASKSAGATAENSISPLQAFGALASWSSLPNPSTVKLVLIVNFNALLPTPSPNPNLFDTRTVKLLETGGETWFNRSDLLAQMVAENRWNEQLVDLVSFASTIPNTVVVVQTGRTIELNTQVGAALLSRGIKAHMFAYTDPTQAPKSRKHQLAQRLWHYFNKSTMIYYEVPVSQRESREFNAIMLRIATVERPLPIVQEVHNPRTYLDPVAERKIFEAVLESHNLSAIIQPDHWVWRLDKYDDIVQALSAVGYDEAIGDYTGRSMDAEGDKPPGPRGTKRELRASRLLVAGSKISVVFENEHILPVARLKQRVVDGTWPVDFAVPMTLDAVRVLSIIDARPQAPQPPLPVLPVLPVLPAQQPPAEQEQQDAPDTEPTQKSPDSPDSSNSFHSLPQDSTDSSSASSESSYKSESSSESEQ